MKNLLTVAATMLIWTGQGQAAILPDPTRPYQYGTEVMVEQVQDGKVEWRLSGIRINENKRSAILNGRLVKEGDKLDGAVVMEIKSSQVTLQLEENRLVVKLLISSIKQPVSTGSNQ